MVLPEHFGRSPAGLHLDRVAAQSAVLGQEPGGAARSYAADAGPWSRRTSPKSGTWWSATAGASPVADHIRPLS
ncbi:hypothetical protein DEJ50_33160 [Streptomyces venezuelae]|uniref:Uncharacterized protein n=1 Tax=Streptomyces venezuelae TaxID=54571 RepID=A0A5P2DBR0_STRVZ|nr:hypothetical protein DEJ50_33160 [Streptomyces venezuelae]